MPPPIVPAPTMATRSILRTGVVSGNAGNARRSAFGKERVTQRARLGRLHEFEEQPPLVTKTVVERHRHRPGDRVDALARRREVLRRPRRWRCGRTGRRRRRSDSRSRHRATACARARLRRRCAQMPAQRRATFPSMTASNSAVSFSVAAATLVPVTIMLSAVSTPTARGSRCVPPAPGSRPSFTSGNASVALAPATR